jgi:nitric oxide reductase NorQ protein
MSETQSDTRERDEQGEKRALSDLDIDFDAWDVEDVTEGDPDTDASKLPDPPSSENAGLSVAEASIPVDRGYRFERAIPARADEYKPSSDAFKKIMLGIANRVGKGGMPRWLIGGPTASGKSMLARYVAYVLGVPFFRIQCHHGMRQSSLVGKVAYVDGETKWVDSTMVHTLLASQQGPCVVLIDEMNRANAKLKDLFFPFLSNECSVTIPERGDETIVGRPDNMIVLATINEGAGYTGTETIDVAELRRYGNMLDVDYLGIGDPGAEVELITERTAVPEDYATRMVNVANEIRDEARINGAAVTMGLPTGTVIEWAQTAWEYDADDEIDQPGIESAEDSFIRMFYSDNDDEMEFVESAVTEGFRGVDMWDMSTESVDVPEAKKALDVECSSCEFSAASNELDEKVLSFMNCPSCDDGTLVFDDL